MLEEKFIDKSTYVMDSSVEAMGDSIAEIEGFYEKVLFFDRDVILFPLLQKGTVDFETGKQLIIDKIGRYMNNLQYVDSTFIYTHSNQDYIFQSKNYSVEKSNWIYSDLTNTSFDNNIHKYEWTLVVFKNKYFLRKYFPFVNDMDVGILIDINKLTANALSDDNSFIFDSSGNPVVYNVYPALDKKFEDAFVIDGVHKEYDQISYDDGGQYIIGKRISGTELFLLSVISKDSIYDMVFFNRAFSILLVACGFIILGVAFFLRRQLSVPMANLVSAMSLIGEEGDLNININTTNSYEFNILTQKFLEMLTQIKKLKIDVYEQELIVSNSEIKILQNQINPHFFMNSLNIIYSLAELKNYELIKKMATHLVNYFRFAVGANRSIVTCEEEVEHLLNYLEIQKLRYKDQMDYEITIREDHLKILLPPLTLQPFVENSIKHGFIKGKRKFCVSVRSRSDESHIYFVICDNGVGLSEEQLVMLNSTAEDDKHQNIGVWNVRKRLEKYISGVSVQFFSETGDGTTVVISLPLIGGELPHV